MEEEQGEKDRREEEKGVRQVKQQQEVEQQQEVQLQLTLE